MANPEIIMVKAIVSALATCMLYTGNEADIRYTFHYTATCATCVIARLYRAIEAWRLRASLPQKRTSGSDGLDGERKYKFNLKSSSGLLRRRRLSSGDFPRSVGGFQAETFQGP